MKAKDVAALLLEHPESKVTVWDIGQGGRVPVGEVEFMEDQNEFVINPVNEG